MKKKKIIICSLIIILLSLVGTGLYFLLGGGNKSLSSAASKLKNTYTASSYTVVTPEGNTYDVINEKDTFYAALVSKGEDHEEYTGYTFLMEDEDIIDASLYEYNNGIEESDYGKIVDDYKDLIYFNDPYVSRFFRIDPTTDDYYRPANGMHLTALKELTKSYREGSSEFDFVETYTYDDESMELILYYEDYLDWCKANVEDFGRVGTLEDPDMILRYVITFEGDYVHQFKKFHHYSEGGSNSEIWTFTNVDEKNEDLSSYIADPKEYFKNVLAEINGKIIVRIEEELKENPDYGYNSKGDIINEGDDFYSVDDYISTYTGDEIIAYLSGDESLPDKSKDWRILYIEYIKNNYKRVIGQSGFSMKDVTFDGIPDILASSGSNSNEWELFYISNGEVKAQTTSYDAYYTKDYIMWDTYGNSSESYVYRKYDSKTQSYTGDLTQLGWTQWYDWDLDDEPKVYYEATIYYNDEGSHRMEDTITESQYNQKLNNLRNKSEEITMDDAYEFYDTEYVTAILNYK